MTINLPGPIRLLVADIDGCLSSGTGSQFDHGLIRRIAETNIASRTDSTVPAITYCTGRPQPYVECLMQNTEAYLPALCEGGTVFFDLPTHSIIMHPEFGEKEERALADLHAELDRRLIGPYVKHEPGKISHVTMIIQPPLNPDVLWDEACEIAAQFGATFVVEKTKICIHILFRDIHKGLGLQWLSEHTGIATSEMAGVGDAGPDLPFLRIVGFAFAPANAQPAVKQTAHYISQKDHSDSVHELIDLIIHHNRSLAAAHPAEKGASFS